MSPRVRCFALQFTIAVCLSWQCVLSPRTCAQLHVEDAAHVELSDAWMLHVLKAEEGDFERQRWMAAVGFGMAAVGWGLGLAFKQQGATTWNSASAGLASAATLSLGLATAAVVIDDRKAASAVLLIGGLTEFALASNTLTLATTHHCDGDCRLMLSTDTLIAAGSILSGLLFHALYPPLYPADGYRAYARLPHNYERVTFAIKWLEARETRARQAGYLSLVWSLGFAAAYAIAASQAKTNSGQIILSLSSATFVLSESVNRVLDAVEQKPSERLSAGLPPP
jgi:hypothetical protein